MDDYDWIVIGEGVSSEFFLYWLNQKTSSKLNILQLSSPLNPSASARGTGLIVPFGIKKGLGFLGELIVDSRKFMIDFCKKNYSTVLEPLDVTHYAFSDDEDFKRRYGHFHESEHLIYALETGYVLNWVSLKNNLRLNSENLNITRKTEHVISIGIGAKQILQTSESLYKFRKCFNGAGYGHKNLNTTKVNGKEVAGDSCIWKNRLVLNKSSLITFQGHNAIQSSSDFTFGSTTDERAQMYAPNWLKLKTAYKLFEKTFPAIDFPSLRASEVVTGIRHKMSKHKPVIGFENNIAHMAGLHKNGYIFANYLAKRLIDQIYQ